MAVLVYCGCWMSQTCCKMIHDTWGVGSAGGGHQHCEVLVNAHQYWSMLLHHQPVVSMLGRRGQGVDGMGWMEGLGLVGSGMVAASAAKS